MSNQSRGVVSNYYYVERNNKVSRRGNGKLTFDNPSTTVAKFAVVVEESDVYLNLKVSYNEYTILSFNFQVTSARLIDRLLSRFIG